MSNDAKSLGPYTTKIHKEELLEVLDLWEMPEAAKSGMERIIESNSAEIKGPPPLPLLQSASEQG